MAGKIAGEMEEVDKKYKRYRKFNSKLEPNMHKPAIYPDSVFLPGITPGIPGVLDESGASCCGDSGKPSNGKRLCLWHHQRQHQH